MASASPAPSWYLARASLTFDTVHHLPAVDTDPVSRQYIGNIIADGRRDKHLLGTRNRFRKSLPPGRIQLGEHIIKDEDGEAFVVVLKSTAQKLPGGKPQGQREGPRLPVGGIPLGRQFSKDEFQLIAMRAHKVDAALKLTLPERVACRKERLFHGFNIG